MIVCTRRLGQSFQVDGDLLITLTRLSETFVELSLATAEVTRHQSLLPGRMTSLGRDIQICLVRLDIHSARFGLDLPDGMTCNRID